MTPDEYAKKYGAANVGPVKTSDAPGINDYMKIKPTLSEDTEALMRARGGVDLRVLAEGAKADTGKLPMHLIPHDAMEMVAKVLDHGQRKYAPRNWEKGIKYSRVLAAMLRHLGQFSLGRKNDPETGLPHMAHAICCGLFLLAYDVRGMETDFNDIPTIPDRSHPRD